MSFSKLTAVLETDNNFESHLRECYRKCRGEHTGNWTSSWRRLLWRKDNQVDTTINTTGQGLSAVGAGTGAAALADAGAAAALSAPVAAAFLYALPVIVSVVATCWWAYNKNERHKINVEIWDFWKEKSSANYDFSSNYENDKPTVFKWLGWFGDVGLQNMKYLDEKNKEATNYFNKKYQEILRSKGALLALISTYNNMQQSNAKKPAELASIKRQADKLSESYLEFGKDLEYIFYRLERFTMYHEMLDYTLRSWVKLTQAEMEKNKNTIEEAVQHHLNTYKVLGSDIKNVMSAIK